MSEQADEIKMDAGSLYRQEVFTDQQTGSIQILTPVTAAGDVDASRPVRYIGQASLMMAGSPLPVSFEIEAGNLAEAVEKFGGAARTAVNNMLEQIQELRREAASGLVIPGQDGGMPPSGGGGIQLR